MISKNNQELLDSFLTYMSTKSSPHTIRSYRTGISQFLTMLGDINFTDIDYSDAEDFQNSILQKGNKGSTANQRKGALSSFSKYVKKRFVKKMHLDNMFELLDSIEDSECDEDEEKMDKYSVGQILGLIKTLEDEGRYNLSTMLALVLYSGRRRAELTRFKVSDFAQDRIKCNGQFYMSRKIQTKGKAGNPMECLIHTAFKPYFDKWMEKREVESEWLFPSEDNPNEHITDENDMGNWADKLKKYPGFEAFHWHAVRHTTVTALLLLGVPREIVVKIIGWKSPHMIDTYNDTSRIDEIENFCKDNADVIAKYGVDSTEENNK